MNKATILLVDDEQNILKALKRTLFETLYEIVLVSSSSEARIYLKNNTVDMIISDYKMPVENGFNLLSFVRDTYPGVIRIMLSGYVEKEVIVETMFSSAALTFFSKPWDDEKLLSRITEILEIKQSLNDIDLWEKINSGSFFTISSELIKKLYGLSKNKTKRKEFEMYVSNDPYLLFRIAGMVSSDFIKIKSEFNLSKAIDLLGVDTILELSIKSTPQVALKSSPYSIMSNMFLSYYDLLFTLMNTDIGLEPLNIFLPFIYLHNYLYLQIDENKYKDELKLFINEGIYIKKSNTADSVFRTILKFSRLPEKFMDNYNKVNTDQSPSIKTAIKLRNLIELFWWSDSMPENHPFYTVPMEILNNMYEDVQRLKKLQL